MDSFDCDDGFGVGRVPPFAQKAVKDMKEAGKELPSDFKED